MQVAIPFSQGSFKATEDLARTQRGEQPRGLCFRLSYKWSACKLRGQPFKFYNGNAASSYRKQMNYLREPDCVRNEDQASYSGWVLAVHRNDEYFIDVWGQSHGDIGCTPHRVLSVSDFLGAGAGTFVYCFYGTTVQGRPWGHAVAYSGTGSAPAFFDSNHGEYHFATAEDKGSAIDAHCDAYAQGGSFIEDRYVYELA